MARPSSGGLLFSRLPFGNAPQNLAAEEYIFLKMRSGSVFLLWEDAPCVVIGKNQDAAAECALGLARSLNVPVYRRKTGGGAVYHDLGNLNFSIIEDYDGDEPPSVPALLSPVTTALAKLGAGAAVSSRNDLSLCGKKFCGTAMRVYKGRILLHGCILFSSDLERLSSLLTPPPSKLERHGIASVKSRVGNLGEMMPGLTLKELCGALKEAAASGRRVETLSFSEKDLLEIGRLAESYEDLSAAHLAGM